MAQKASNIALIKYMGKTRDGKNSPINPSLSWTLDHLFSTVIIEKSSGGCDSWEILEDSFPFGMSPIGLKKYLGHLQRLKNYFGVHDYFKVRSGNNFPSDCGLASSASSFAALTEAACMAFSEITGKNPDLSEKVQLSTMGSGSSSRSFLKGWVFWDGTKIRVLESPFQSLFHMVVVVGDQPKEVSSSKAHKKVSSSLLFQGRGQRAESRLGFFMKHLENPNQWDGLYQIAWQEFWDMHALFETSQPSFGYLQPETLGILKQAQNLWLVHNDGPLVTMDAGPNVHLLFRSDQDSLMLDFFRMHLKGRWTCLSNHGDIGFAQI